MNTKTQHKTGKKPDVRIIFGIILVLIGTAYILIDIIHRHQSLNVLGVFRYKAIIESCRDCIFAIGLIIGGVLLAVKSKYTWYFIMLYSLGNILTLIFELSFSVHYRSSFFGRFILGTFVSILLLFIFNRKRFRPEKYIVPIAVISTIILTINILLDLIGYVEF